MARGVQIPVTFSTIYGQQDFALSFELFPPKSDDGADELREHVSRLIRYTPQFITCTYGAGGSTQNNTLKTLGMVQELCDLPLASHLTCVGATIGELRDYLQQVQEQGITNIVALRGDPPKGEKAFVPTEGGLAYANELVAMLAAEFPHFGIAVAGYPETHPEAPNAEADLMRLKQKVDAGADAVITQFFFHNESFLRWRDRCHKAGIDIPIVPGILPITNFKQVRRFSEFCGAELPAALTASLEQCIEDAEAQLRIGVDHATKQLGDLMDEGIPGAHMYVLNKSRATTEVLSSLNFSRS